MRNELENTPLSLQQLLQYHDAVSSDFMQKWEQGYINEGRLKADNYTADMKAKIQLQDRIPYSMPVAVSALQRISATQKQSRVSWKVEASSDPNDEVPAEVGTIVMRDYERREDMAHKESDVFDNGIGVSFGADKFEIVNEFGQDKIKNRKVDTFNLVWDLNDKSYSLDNVQFIAEIERIPYKDLKAMGYEVEGATDTYGTLEGRAVIDYYGVGDPDDRIISVFHHYHRTEKKYYVVLFSDPKKLFVEADGVTSLFNGVVIKKTRNRKEAETLKKDIEMVYALNGFDANEDNGLSIETQSVTEYDYYKFTYNKLLEYKETGETFHPYNLYFAIKVANDWISLLDFMESPQLFTDRLWSQIDYSFKTELKNVMEMNVNALAEGETADTAAKKASKTGGVIRKKGYQRIFETVQTTGFNPQYMSVLNILQQTLRDTMGGGNALGLQESASESGRAIALRQQQGKLVAFLFLDNFNRYKEAKGKKLLELIKKYDTTQRVIKIIGGALTDEMAQFLMANGAINPSQTSNNLYLKTNTGVTSLQNKDLDLVIDSVPMNDYERQAKLDMYSIAEKNMPQLLQSPTWMQIKLDALDIPKADRQKLMQETQALQQQQQAMLQQPVSQQVGAK